MSAKEKLKSYLLGKTEETPPENIGVDIGSFREVLDAKQTEILGAVNGAIDERLKAFTPLLDEIKAKEEEKNLLEQLNSSRAKRGLPPIEAEKDDEKEERKEDDEKKDMKSPGKHPKRYSEEEKEDKKESVDVAELVRAEISKAVKFLQPKQASNESTALEVDSSMKGEKSLTLKNGGHTVPFVKSWEYLKEQAPGIRQAMYTNGFDQSAVDEFDVACADAKFDLRNKGVQEPITKNFA